jgi:hypothetical protein
MIMRTRTVGLCLVALLGALQACGPTQGTDPVASPGVTSGDADVQLVDEQDADLVLYVSNQSFDDEEVRLTVEVDDVVVVDGDFHVEDQHNWIRFNLGMPAGEHEVTASSDSGATLSETFRLPGDEPRYAVLDHWGEDSSAELTWSFHRKPVAFA